MPANGQANRGVTTTTKKELVERVVQRTGIQRNHVRQTIQDFLDLIVSELKKGNRLEFRDFGVFELKERAARTAQNPRTMEKVTVPARRSVKFKAGRAIREVLGPVPTTDILSEPKPVKKRATATSSPSRE